MILHELHNGWKQGNDDEFMIPEEDHLHQDEEMNIHRSDGNSPS